MTDYFVVKCKIYPFRKIGLKTITIIGSYFTDKDQVDDIGLNVSVFSFDITTYTLDVVTPDKTLVIPNNSCITDSLQIKQIFYNSDKKSC